MQRTREMMAADEDRILAPYAQRVSATAGRVHREPQHPYRTDYQRDRARIIHSRAFRRLDYKTQVFLNGTGDHLRTRLTHTIEVASVSRTIARALGANEDLAEAIALAHDLGHAPFGHSGEEKLNELMRGHGGFEHNLQSLRLVEVVESVYPAFAGLNLSYEVLEGLRKHDRGYSRPAVGEAAATDFPSPSLEAQIANVADEITYYSHDLDDGLDHNLIEVGHLKDIVLWQKCSEYVKRHFPDLEGRRFHSYVIRTLIDHEVEDLVSATSQRLVEADVHAADEVRALPKLLAGYSPALAAANRELRKFLYRNLYYHPEVSGPNQRGCAMIEAVFKCYLEQPELLGASTTERIEREGLHRTVCDYISGMTDRYITEEYQRLA